ncbi:MAG: hypothetical protein DYG99_14730 [Bacteroidetes bacterium CHB5]|nr:hypothetical protein [Bacteroidetes bacterium CHB5]
MLTCFIKPPPLLGFFTNRHATKLPVKNTGMGGKLRSLIEFGATIAEKIITSSIFRVSSYWQLLIQTDNTRYTVSHCF